MKFLFLGISCSIVFLISIIVLKRIRNQKNLVDLNYSEEGRNIALSISNCKKLHKELAKIAHPDRFKEDKREAANKLSQEINSAKYDYKKLLMLKSEVQLFLNNQ